MELLVLLLLFLVAKPVHASLEYFFPKSQQVLFSVDGSFEASFPIVNAGSIPLVVVSVRSSAHECDVRYPRLPLMPRQSGSIVLLCQGLDEGYFDKKLEVTIHDPHVSHSLSVTGYTYRSQNQRINRCVRQFDDRPSATWLEDRLSHPSEGLTSYADYLRYQDAWSTESKVRYESYVAKKLSCKQLIQESFTMAWIGDSLSKDFHISSDNFGTVVRARNANQADVFFDQNDNHVLSFTERVASIVPTYAANFARAGGGINTMNDFVDRSLLRKKNLAAQIDDVLQMKSKPSYIGIWIGHNDTDYKQDIKSAVLSESMHRARAENAAKTYVEQLDRLIDGLEDEHKNIAIMLYGIGNVEQYATRARPQIESLRRLEPSRYPESERGVYKVCPSLKPEHRAELLVAYRQLYSAMKTQIARYLDRNPPPAHVRVSYSDALNAMDYGNLEYFHEQDGWHFSDSGKTEIARRIWESSQEAIEFAGARR